MRRTIGWGLAVAVACGVVVAHGQRPALTSAITELGVPGAANANPTIDARGSSVALAWGVTGSNGGTDVYVALSHDGGATFGPPVRVNSDQAEARTSAERPPVVALVPSARGTPDVAVLWTAGRTDTALKLARSRDGGRTFSKPRELQAPGAKGSRGWASMTAGDDGTLHVVWLDHRETVAGHGGDNAGHQHGSGSGPARDGAAMAQRSGLYYLRLGDGAVAERLLARGVCYCCKTAVAAGSGGRIATAWRHVYPGNLRDIAAATSADGGRTFTAAQRVSQDGWAIDGCPENGPSVALLDGQLHLAWPTVVGTREPAGAIFYSRSRDGGAFSPRIRIPTLAGRDPEHVQMAQGDGQTLMVAWDEVVEGRRTVVASRVRPDGTGATIGLPRVVSLGRAARHPALARTSRGTLVAWTDGAADGATTIGIREIADESGSQLSVVGSR